MLFQLSRWGNSDDADLPLLQFGMIGFDSNQRQQIEGIVHALPQQTATWCAGVFANANAWLICGEKTRALPPSATTSHGNLRVLAGLPSEHAVILNLHQINRPLAFSLPLSSSDMEPRFTFEAASPHSVQTVLKKFELCLWSLRSQFILGKELVQREMELKPAIYHVIYHGKLLAVMDFIAWKIGMLPNTDPQHFGNAAWEKRPVEARTIPGDFLLTDVAQLRWVYAQHSAQDVLPARYHQGLIYFRQSPQVPLSWLTDSHLLLLRELSRHPASLMTLAARTGLPYERLTRDLAGLYFASSLTTTPGKAAKADASKAQPTRTDPSSAAKNPPNIFNSTLPHDDDTLSNEDATVPAQLRSQ